MTVTDELLHDHLRRTLQAVAATVAEGDRPAPMLPQRSRRRVRRLVVATAGLAGASGLGMVAWDRWEEGEIRRIPTEAALMEGTASSGRWWLLPSAALHDAACPASVEFVSAASNQVGDEWNTGGVVYGEPYSPPEGAKYVPETCPDPAPWLANPARFEFGSTSVAPSPDGGDADSDVGWFGTFHPSVTKLRVTTPDGTTTVVRTEPLPEAPDGPRFAAFTTARREGTQVALLRDDDTTVTAWGARYG